MKDEKVVSLRETGFVAEGRAVPGVVEYLRECLAEAERGEFVALGLIKISANNEIGVNWRLVEGTGHSHLIVAGCSYLAHDIAKAGSEG